MVYSTKRIPNVLLLVVTLCFIIPATGIPETSPIITDIIPSTTISEFESGLTFPEIENSIYCSTVGSSSHVTSVPNVIPYENSFQKCPRTDLNPVSHENGHDGEHENEIEGKRISDVKFEPYVPLQMSKNTSASKLDDNPDSDGEKTTIQKFYGSHGGGVFSIIMTIVGVSGVGFIYFIYKVIRIYIYRRRMNYLIRFAREDHGLDGFLEREGIRIGLEIQNRFLREIDEMGDDEVIDILAVEGDGQHPFLRALDDDEENIRVLREFLLRGGAN